MVKTIESTPQNDGFRAPGEFEPHRGCWMLWPERPDNWRLNAKPAQFAFAEVAKCISTFEPVTVGVSNTQYLYARSILPDKIRILEISSNDAWIRDSGPTFIVNDRGEIRGVDWEFNGWGGSDAKIYSSWDLDNLVARKILEIENIDRYKAPIILEGGSIQFDGEGTVITTEECLLNPNRNPLLTKVQLEQQLKQYLNVSNVIWLDKGLYNDETSGHVDNLCSFIRPGVVAITWTDDRTDPQYKISMDAYERLQHIRDAKGRNFEIHKIHQPGPLFITYEESKGIDRRNNNTTRLVGQRLPGSYINFYIANGGVVVPIFNDPFDSVALKQIQRLFPTHQVMGIYSREILLGGGNIHCITQQQPLALCNG